MTLRPLLSREAITERIVALAADVARDLSSPIVLGILDGAAPFMMELLRHLPEEAARQLQYDFVDATSYRGTESTGRVTLTRRGRLDVSGRDVLVVDGIVDTGATLRAVLDDLAARRPRAVRTCVLLDKPARRRVEVRLDYVGFEIDDLFVVGYGMDLDGRFRGLRHIAVVDPDRGAGGDAGPGRPPAA